MNRFQIIEWISVKDRFPKKSGWYMSISVTYSIDMYCYVNSTLNNPFDPSITHWSEPLKLPKELPETPSITPEIRLAIVKQFLWSIIEPLAMSKYSDENLRGAFIAIETSSALKALEAEAKGDA